MSKMTKVIEGDDFCLDDIYTPLGKAKEEIWERWSCPELEKDVEYFLKDDIPQNLKDSPKAVLWRFIATPNNEYIYFLELAKKTGLTSLMLEMPSDKFTANNPCKYFLGKMFFYYGKGRNGGHRTTCRKIIDISDNQGKQLSNIKTLSDIELVTLHHQLFDFNFPRSERYDDSPWWQRGGVNPESCYKTMMALCVRNIVMFENFLMDGMERKFTETIVLPAFQEVTSYFGVKPLIVRLLPGESETYDYWCWYPGFMEEQVKKLLANGDKDKLAGRSQGYE